MITLMFMREDIGSAKVGEQSELQRFASEFVGRLAELRRHFELRSGEVRGPAFLGFENYINQLETLVDTQFILHHGSMRKIREATRLVDGAIAEIGRSRQSGRTPWPDQGEFMDWLNAVKKLAGDPFKH